MDHPVLGPITRRLEYDAHPVGRAPIRYSNTHRPAARSNTLVLGGKTGFNNAARYCLVLAAEVGGRTLGMAFLGTEGELTRFGDVGRVSDWVVAYRAADPRRAPGPTVEERAASGGRTEPWHRHRPRSPATAVPGRRHRQRPAAAPGAAQPPPATLDRSTASGRA